MEIKNKKILVTGGSGFLGRRILENLREKDALVYTSKKKFFDLTDEKYTQELFSEVKPDIVIHSAALYGGLGINEEMPAEIFDVNTRMLLNVFKACIDPKSKKPRIEKMVSIGSACSYPSVLGTNMSEDKLWNGPVDASVVNYGSVKKNMEIAGNVYRSQYGLHSIHLPLATLYGEWDTFNPTRSHVPAAFIRKFVEAYQKHKENVEHWGVPETVREFMYVGDAAEGIVRSLESFEGVDNVSNQSKYTLNLGTGHGITIDELSNTIASIVGYNGEVTYNGNSVGQKEKALKVDRMREYLGWEPKTSLRDGLEKTIKWYIINKEEADRRF